MGEKDTRSRHHPQVTQLADRDLKMIMMNVFKVENYVRYMIILKMNQMEILELKNRIIEI